MEPISSPNGSIAKGPAKSHEFNKLINDMHTDIANLFDINNYNGDLIDKVLDIYSIENDALNRRITDLQGQVASLNNMVQDLKYNRDIKTLYGGLDAITNINACIESDIVTLPVNARVNQLAISGSDSIYIPDTLKVAITESVDGGNNYYDIASSTKFIKGEYWARSVTVPEGQNVEYVKCKIHIDVPIGLTNNPYSNVIRLVPYPMYDVIAEELSCVDAAGNKYVVPYEGTVNIFNDISDIASIDITIKQSRNFKQDGNTVFVYGLREFGLYYYDFANNGSFVMPFSIENTSAYFNSLIEPTTTNGVSYQAFTDSSLAMEIWFGDEITEYTQKVYLKVNMEKKDTIPIIRSISLPFNVRSVS